MAQSNQINPIGWIKSNILKENSPYKDYIRLACVGIIALKLLIDNNVLFVNILSIMSIVMLIEFAFGNNFNEIEKLANILTSVLLLTVLLPLDLHWWQMIIFSSFGVVIGEQIFGGRGYSFVSPIVCALAFYHYSYSTHSAAPVDELHVLWPVLAAVPLVLINALNWRAIATLIASVLIMAFAFNLELAIPSTAVVLCVLFAGLDKANQPVSQSGRWLYGVIVGVLLILLTPSLDMLDKAVSACLLASVFIPLVDSISKMLRSTNRGKSNVPH